MHTNVNVAELVTLLKTHGISVPGESEATSDTAESASAVLAAGTAVAEAPADEIGFVRCTNCHAQLALYAADAASFDDVAANAPAATNAAPAVVNAAPAVINAAPAVVNAAPAAGNTAPTSSNRSLSPRWYAVTAARQVGVMYAVWDPVIKDLVNGVSAWSAVKFNTEAEARRRYNEEEAAGRLRIWNPQAPA